MAQNNEIIFTGVEIFSAKISALVQMYNIKTQQRTLLPKYKNELIKSIISGDWTWFKNFDGLKNIKSTCGIPKYNIDDKDQKIMIFFDKNKMYIGNGIDFSSRPDKFEGLTKHQIRMSKLFRMLKKEPKCQFDVVEFSSESELYKQVLTICEVFVSDLIMNMISLSDEEFTNNMFSHKINGIEISCYLALKSITQKIAVAETDYKDKSSKKPESDKTKTALDVLKLYYKIHDFICKIVLLDFTLEAFKWYSFVCNDKAEKLIKGGIDAIFATDIDGLIVKHKSPVDTVISMQNKDTMSLTVRSKEKNYIFSDKVNDRSVSIDMNLKF